MSMHSGQFARDLHPGTPEPRTRPHGTAPHPDPWEPGPEPEWGLSAGQVTALVLAILAACELMGLF